MLDIREMRYLTAVADKGSVLAAAKGLGISQPVLSRAMKQIESKLQIPLLEKAGGNRLKLNGTGVYVAEEARKALDELRFMDDRISAFIRNQSTVSVGSCVPAPLWSLLPRVQGLAPQMRVTSELKGETAVQQGLLSGKYTLAITLSPVTESGFVSELYDTEQLHISVPLYHRFSSKDTILLSELAGETMLLFHELGIWQEIPNSLSGKVNFIVVKDYQVFSELAHASPMLCFATNMTGSHSTKENPRIEIPISDPGAIKNFYLSCAEKHRELLYKLFPYPV